MAAVQPEEKVFKTSKCVNTTPHDIHIFDAEGKELSYIIMKDPDMQIRVPTKKQRRIGRVHIGPSSVGLVTPQVPEPFDTDIRRKIKVASEERATLITSYYTAAELKKQFPGYAGLILGPDTGPDSVVRDEKGRIRGVRQFEAHHLPESALSALGIRSDEEREKKG
jgi:hypothetical protein